jgi:hypothetical protein
MKNQTAIDWVLQYLNNVRPDEFCSIEKIKELLTQAKAMQREQINKAFSDGFHCGYEGIEDTEDYYSENYGGDK